MYMILRYLFLIILNILVSLGSYFFIILISKYKLFINRVFNYKLCIVLIFLRNIKEIILKNKS